MNTWNGIRVANFVFFPIRFYHESVVLAQSRVVPWIGLRWVARRTHGVVRWVGVAFLTDIALGVVVILSFRESSVRRRVPQWLMWILRLPKVRSAPAIKSANDDP